jgi:UDP-GlcNAc:undecaprenyl-phosphate GlcNAc-1-phosphate transferase
MTMMRAMQILVPAVCSATLSAALCYTLARWSARLRLVARPRPDRWHQSPTPNTGGLAILSACAAAYVLFARTGYRTVAACAVFVSLLGFVDDRLQLPPRAKLAGQAAAAAVVICAGMTLEWTPWYWINVTVTAVWIVGITNAFNLIDNMDGLCGGVAAIAAISGAVLASLGHDPQRTLLLTIIGTACLGFLVFNHKPARIFMGDCGSMFLGFSLATLAIGSPRHGDSILNSLYGLPAFLYPVFDTILVSVLRRAAGKPVSVGGRDHSSHRLVSTGLTERETVWILWSITALCAFYGLLAYNRPASFMFVTALLLTAFAIFGTYLARLPGFAIRTRSQSAELLFRYLESDPHRRPGRTAALPDEPNAFRIATPAKAPSRGK